MASTDACEAMLNFLRTSALAAPLRALVVNGTDGAKGYGIYQAGDLSEDDLKDAESIRSSNQVLAIEVQDAGERVQNNGVTMQFVSVRFYDRRRGYTNIRAARNEFVDLITSVACIPFSDGYGMGVLDVRYVGRSGMRRDRIYAVEYEAVDVSFLVSVENLIN